MFTVKHTSPSVSNETIYSCEEVRFLPRSYDAPPDVPEVVTMTGGSGAGIHLSDGMIYVMNDHGATVAKYDLGYIVRPTTAPEVQA